MSGVNVSASPLSTAVMQLRQRSDSKTTMSDAESFAAGPSTSDLIEITTPPLVVISSRAKSPGALASCVNPGVAVVKYNYESTTLAKLLQLISAQLKGRLALSVAFIMHGQPECLKMCSQKVITIVTKMLYACG